MTRPHPPAARPRIAHLGYWRWVRRMGRRAYTVVFSGLWLAIVAWTFWLFASDYGDAVWVGATPFVFAVFAAVGPFLALRGWDLHESSYQHHLEQAARPGGSTGGRQAGP